jgi:hypothetical protein
MVLQMDLADPRGAAEVAFWGKDRLITPAELKAADYKKLGDLSAGERAQAEKAGQVICEACVAGRQHQHHGH